jgi:hypothetical protein
MIRIPSFISRRSKLMPRFIAVGFVLFFACLAIPCLLSDENSYTSDEIIAITKDLGKKIDAPEGKIEDLIQGFKQAAEQDEFKAAQKKMAITAVFVYKATEGGLVYKRMAGRGNVIFKQDNKTSPVKLSSGTYGAQIGGSAEWGLGLIMGLKNALDFGGSYAGKKKSATAVNSTAARGEMFSNSDYVESSKTHNIYLIATGSGLSAGVSKGKITISLEK